MKIVRNSCYGGLSFSKELYKELGIEWDNYGYLSNEKLGIKSENIEEFRTSQKLISAIEKIGEKMASGDLSRLEVVEIPDGIIWTISDYDGIETIEEKHRSW